jgi:hypothetical protein
LKCDDRAACQSSADIAVPQIPVGMILGNFVSGDFMCGVWWVTAEQVTDRQKYTFEDTFSEMSCYFSQQQ